MSTTVHTFTDDNGVDHTRTSKTRTYTHCVVMVIDRDRELEARRAELARVEARRIAEPVSSIVEVPSYSRHLTLDEYRQQMTAYHAQQSAYYGARVAKVEAQPAVYYEVLSWSGSAELAAKAVRAKANSWVARDGHALVARPVTSTRVKGGAR